MRIRDFFRGPSTNDRKLTLSSSSTSLQAPVIDVKTFLNAALENDTQTLQKYLLAGFPVDQADPATQSRALHLAAETGHLATCQLLLQANAQVNVTNSSLSSPLHCAAYAGYDEIVQLLLAHGADPLQQDNTGRNPFHWAVTSGNLRLVEHFLALKDSETNLINVPDRHRWTPLMCACASNQASTCALLLGHQADLTSRNDRGMTIFHLIAFLGSANLLREILSTIDEETAIELLNQVDQHNQTPLFVACIEGHLDVALTLIHAGANPYHLDDDQQTCLHAMFHSGIILRRHLFLFYRFIQFVDFRHQQDCLGRTLLDLAILNRYQTLINLLQLLKYQQNVSPTIINSERSSLLSLRQISILKFKQSIHSSHRLENPEDILRSAFEQVFHLHDDLVILPSTNQTTKYQKNHKTIKQLDKKLRKTMSIFHLTSSHNNNNNNSGTSANSSEKSSSQMDLSRSKSQPVGSTRRLIHPMTNLMRKILLNEHKFFELIDFPSLNGNPLLDKDLQWSIENYQLLGSSTVKSN